MPLVARTKPKAHVKKRHAMHHRRSHHYMKPYLPYLPVLAIIGMGAFVDKLWSASNTGINPAVATTRIGLVTGNSSTSLYFAVLGVTALAFAVFVLLHWYRIKRMLNRGEKFMVEHAWFDVSLVFVVTAGVVLTRA